MMSIQLAEPTPRCDQQSESRSGGRSRVPVGPTSAVRRRSRSRNTRRPPSGLVMVSPALNSGPDATDQPVQPYRPYRMSQRARLAMTTTVVAAALVIGLTAALTGGSAGTGMVTVSTGDSLWIIAQRVAPDADIWLVVDQITELNGLSSTVLRPGQRLVVPLP